MMRHARAMRCPKLNICVRACYALSGADLAALARLLQVHLAWVGVYDDLRREGRTTMRMAELEALGRKHGLPATPGLTLREEVPARSLAPSSWSCSDDVECDAGDGFGVVCSEMMCARVCGRARASPLHHLSTSTQRLGTSPLTASPGVHAIEITY
eukprot:1535132-Rhodomonas_salina.1